MSDDIVAQVRVIIRFSDELSDDPDPASLLRNSEPKRWNDFVADFGEPKFSRSLGQLSSRRIGELQKRAAETDPNYIPANFDAFFDIELERDVPPEKVAERLRAWRIVRSVDIEIIGPDPLVTPGDDPRFSNQGYLDAAPDGIGVASAWALAGGDGAGQRFADVERGWTVDHEDLVGNSPTLINGAIRDASRGHGTSVLGQICAVDNTIGCVGIAPNVAGVLCSSYWGSTLPEAILNAAGAMDFGDTILLEVQVQVSTTPEGNSTYGPCETIDLNFEAIRLAVALGMIVVEAGGNGTYVGGSATTPAVDLDAYTKGGQQILNPASADFRDSGAIMVAAASSAAPHTRMSWSTHGARMDCYGWGENIDTLSSNSSGSTTMYRSNFGGTSGASPIVTGAALCVQGVFEAQNGFRLSPGQMRAILSDPATNTPASPAETSLMGVMPDLAQILGPQLGLRPDIYLRDFVGDDGDPHGGAISSSPDIIVRTTAVANPQAAFGAGSGTEMLNDLGHVVEAGQDNFIYVRALNRGEASASGATARIFWSPPSTLLTPDLWTEVGVKSMPDLPIGDLLTCADALVWPAAEIPGTGHYCFVGLLDHPLDPAPPLASFENWDNFRTFIRRNNNVTWRNFNVVGVDPAAPEPGPLNFAVAGWIDRPLPMGIEMRLKLPTGSKVLLDLPLRFLRDLDANLNIVKIDERRRRAIAQLPSGGRVVLGQGNIPAKARYDMTLQVALPDGVSGNIGRVDVRQLYKNEEEVGRVTWLFQDRRIRDELDKKLGAAS